MIKKVNLTKLKLIKNKLDEDFGLRVLNILNNLLSIQEINLKRNFCSDETRILIEKSEFFFI